MNKKLMAAAVAGALVAPAAFAQSSTVQIYGLLNVEYGFYNNQARATGLDRSQVDGLNSGASRIGFKGEEKLSGGMSAFWQCESDVRFLGGSTTTTSGSLCDRNSALGLKGGFGSVYIGTWDSPMKRVSGMTRITNETGWIGSQQMTLSDGGAWTGTFSTRGTSTVNYDTPNFGGFSASVQYSTLQVGRNTTLATVTEKGRQISLSGQYVAGPMAIVAAYTKHDDDRSRATTQGLEDTAYFIGGTYQIGPVKLGLSYIDAEMETGVGTTTERKSWALAGDWNLGGPHSVKFGYANAGDAKTSVGGGNDTGAKLLQIGYHHALSKRTSASLSYGRIDNDSAGTYSFTGLTKGAAILPGNNGSVIVLGMVHTF